MSVVFSLIAIRLHGKLIETLLKNNYSKTVFEIYFTPRNTFTYLCT